MQTIIQIEPNEWVSEDLLMAVTGMKRGTITRARKSSWLLGREYKHVSPEGEPKPTANACTTAKRWTHGFRRKSNHWVIGRYETGKLATLLDVGRDK